MSQRRGGYKEKNFSSSTLVISLEVVTCELKLFFTLTIVEKKSLTA